MVEADLPRPARGSSRRRVRGLRDRLVRAIGVPVLGLVIPQIAGTFGSLDWRHPAYGAGVVAFVLFAWFIWQGNRRILLGLPHSVDWLRRPGRRIAMVLVRTLSFTLPSTVAAVALWYTVGPLRAIDWGALGLATLLVAASVLLVCSLYETWFLVIDRYQDRLTLEHLQRLRLEAQLGALRTQLTPHFIFNCLSILNSLIAEDPGRARQFTQHLGLVCRHLVRQQDRTLIPLAEERAFFEAYLALALLRFPAGLSVEREGFEEEHRWMIPPASLQLLLENAVKHNTIGPDTPLTVRLSLREGEIVASNPARFSRPSEHSLGVGLTNLRERFRMVTGREIAVEREEGQFTVRLPLMPTLPAESGERKSPPTPGGLSL